MLAALFQAGACKGQLSSEAKCRACLRENEASATACTAVDKSYFCTPEPPKCKPCDRINRWPNGEPRCDVAWVSAATAAQPAFNTSARRIRTSARSAPNIPTAQQIMAQSSAAQVGAARAPIPNASTAHTAAPSITSAAVRASFQPVLSMVPPQMIPTSVGRLGSSSPPI